MLDNTHHSSDQTPMTPRCLCTCRSIWLSGKFSRLQGRCVRPQTVLLDNNSSLHASNRPLCDISTCHLSVWNSWNNLHFLSLFRGQRHNPLLSPQIWYEQQQREDICIIFVKHDVTDTERGGRWNSQIIITYSNERKNGSSERNGLLICDTVMCFTYCLRCFSRQEVTLNVSHSNVTWANFYNNINAMCGEKERKDRKGSQIIEAVFFFYSEWI